ncbi:MAG: UDP-N-acetylmuramoyl-L-alanyl-D-glutamate--2,6-diaminopimelate ligase [Thermodesulfobacteriota bacterium]
MDKISKWESLLQSSGNAARIQIDSRLVGPGDIFVALNGCKVDGAKFVQDALEAGAAYAVVRKDAGGFAADERIVFCEDPSAFLGELAGAAFGTKRLKARIVGVTGTNGKTSFTYILEHLLRSAGYKVGVIGTVETRWPGVVQDEGMTTPDCLRLHSILREMEKDGVDIVCMEVSSHALDQNRVAGIVFDYAVFTNLTQDHLDYHPDMEHYFKAKKKLFSPQEGQVPKAVVNVDDNYGRELARDLGDALTYGLDKVFAPRLRGEISRLSPQGLRMQCSYEHLAWEIESPLVGRYNASNLLAAMGTGLEMGLKISDFSSLRDFKGIPGRLQSIANARGIKVLVDYAHTPDALENCCLALRDTGLSFLVVVFGCGGNRDAGKRPIMGRIACKYADVVIITSDNPRNEPPEAIISDILRGTDGCRKVLVEPDRRKALALGVKKCPTQGALLVAGKGHETYQEIGGKRREFDDAGVLSEVMA